MYGKCLVVKKTYLAAHLLSGVESFSSARLLALEKCNQNGAEYLIVEVLAEMSPEQPAPEPGMKRDGGDAPLPETPTPEKVVTDKSGGSGTKLKLLNKETVSFVLLHELDCSPQEVFDIVEMIWDSDAILQRIYAA